MSKNEKFTRLLIKRTDIPGLSATTASSDDHTLLPAWNTTDIYEGEFFFNTVDEKLWIRTKNNIRKVLFDDLSGTTTIINFSGTPTKQYEILAWNPTGNTWQVSDKLIEPGSFIFNPTKGVLEYNTPENGYYQIVLFGTDASSGLTDVTAGDVLTFDGTSWINKKLSITNISSAYTGLTTDQYIRCSGATYTIQLPNAAGTGKFLYVKNIASGTITVAGGLNTIDDASFVNLTSKYSILKLIDVASGKWETM